MAERPAVPSHESKVKSTRRKFVASVSVLGAAAAAGLLKRFPVPARDQARGLEKMELHNIENDISQLQKDATELKVLSLKLMGLINRINGFISNVGSYTREEIKALAEDVESVGPLPSTLVAGIQMKILHLREHEAIKNPGSVNSYQSVVGEVTKQAAEGIDDMNRLIPVWDNTRRVFKNLLDELKKVSLERQEL